MAVITTGVHPNGLEYIEIDSELCHARVFLQGAQIESFTPKGKAPLLWVSSADDYQPGSGIRGGIPVCWPWFGQHPDADWPQHGFARNHMWQRLNSAVQDEVVTLSFVLPLTDADRVYWPHHTRVELHCRFSHELRVSLVNINQDQHPVTLTQALHSYFPIGDIHQLVASGFKGARYIEFGKGPYDQLQDSVRFDKETDRVYTALGNIQTLQTPNGTIVVKRERSRSAILWNPWIEKSRRLSRFHDDDYLQMVCLEAANVLDDAVTLAPGERHVLATEISWQD
ncbi:D-hexose-6-phosphate mutarotase [Shewanella sp. A32]|uniref:D-hexose-6-phosphate mutarotase n=1 Tax=Shewanella sp. A32 TaxID=3031327 RepID=UPI0023B9D67F|nr:D-hexose-6-phosphate mutarotase [Shewanella sp. A32]MDF0535385.1 D-hexose-6-phosphate mutarotase [Shewanella sp. A32]